MTDLSPETVGKLVALVRRLRSDFCMLVPIEVLREAQAIVLPEPVDPDLVEARVLIAEIAITNPSYSVILPTRDGIGRRVWGHEAHAAALDGQADESPAFQAILAAIKRGRALAAGDRRDSWR